MSFPISPYEELGTVFYFEKSFFHMIQILLEKTEEIDPCFPVSISQDFETGAALGVAKHLFVDGDLEVLVHPRHAGEFGKSLFHGDFGVATEFDLGGSWIQSNCNMGFNDNLIPREST